MTTSSPPPTGGDDAATPERPPVRVDPRVVLANERTLLAWDRTAIAFIVGGLAATELLESAELPFGRRLVGLPLIAMGAIIAGHSQLRWRARERAINEGTAFPPSELPWLVSAVLVAVALVALVLAAR